MVSHRRHREVKPRCAACLEATADSKHTLFKDREQLTFELSASVPCSRSRVRKIAARLKECPAQQAAPGWGGSACLQARGMKNSLAMAKTLGTVHGHWQPCGR
ncbi:hypothetical protein WJX73_001409 [Symbiochloris irregularis]|uniref:Uncharacterized protein n=1 Tax=Symbiochloris irregularis TaxID=706552 RepID=A0AAW1Q053_9CHLO